MPEQEADLLEGQPRVFAQEVHRDVARLSDGPGAALACERLDGDTVAGGNGLEQGVGVRRLRDGRLKGSESAGGAVQGDRRVNEVGVGHDAMKQALELAHVVRRAVGEEASDLQREIDALFGGLGLDDREPGLGVRWLDVSDKAPLEARGKASGESRHGRRAGGRR